MDTWSPALPGANPKRKDVTMKNKESPSWAEHLQALAAAGIVTVMLYGFGVAGLLILMISVADLE
jgi:hypothetical protein